MYRDCEKSLYIEFVPIIPRGATLQGDPGEPSKTICKISTCLVHGFQEALYKISTRKKVHLKKLLINKNGMIL